MGLSDLLIYDGTTPIPLIIWAIYTGLTIAVISSYIVRNKYGKFVSKMIEIGATTPENAVKLDNLEINGKYFIKFALKNPQNYKDALVAITSDGRYYTNYRYTTEAPILKMHRAIARTKKSRVKSYNAQKDEATKAQTEETVIAPEQELTNDANVTRERIKFSVEDARYYLPVENHDKINGIYNEKKSKLSFLIFALIIGAIITYYATPIIEQILQMWSNI